MQPTVPGALPRATEIPPDAKEAAGVEDFPWGSWWKELGASWSSASVHASGFRWVEVRLDTVTGALATLLFNHPGLWLKGSWHLCYFHYDPQHPEPPCSRVSISCLLLPLTLACCMKASPANCQVPPRYRLLLMSIHSPHQPSEKKWEVR